MTKTEVAGPATGGAGELRQELITDKWVVIAPGRGKRPSDFKETRDQSSTTSDKKYVESCPFCNAQKYPQETDVVRLPDDPDHWQVHIFGNKYPAFVAGKELAAWQVGPHRASRAVGYHEILATRWHNQHEAVQSPRFFEMQLEALVLRYRQLKVQQSVNYIQIIKNYGPQGGASLEHPHHQIFTTPVLPSEVADLLHGAERYAKKQGRDAFEVMLDFERREGVRIVGENERFVALCPFASRVPFETWIIPKDPNPFFENLAVADRDDLARLFQDVLRRLYVGLNDPSYNYVIYSAPCDDTGFVCDASVFQHWRWHIQILPRFGTWGGFELGTGLEINSVVPEEAAEFLRGVDISAVKQVL